MEGKTEQRPWIAGLWNSPPPPQDWNETASGEPPDAAHESDRPCMRRSLVSRINT